MTYPSYINYFFLLFIMLEQNSKLSFQPGSLSFSRGDVGYLIELFSFRTNNWERLQLVDYDFTKRLHLCKPVNSSGSESLLWMDLNRKPIKIAER